MSESAQFKCFLFKKKKLNKEINANVTLKVLFPSTLSTNKFGAQPSLEITSSYLTVYTSRYLQKHVPASLARLSQDPPPSPSPGLFNPH